MRRVWFRTLGILFLAGLSFHFSSCDDEPDLVLPPVMGPPPVHDYPRVSPDEMAVCLAVRDLYTAPFSDGALDPTTFQRITTVGDVIHASRSPAGDWIAFDTGYNDPRGSRAVWRVRPDGTERTDLSVHGTGEWLDPSWDPTGTRIVYARYVSGGTHASELFVMDTDGANSKRLTNNAMMDIAPCFSPDGSQICYESFGERRGPNICVMNANGSGHRVLAAGSNPAWSPDGTEIAYVAASGEPGTNGTIWLVNVCTLTKVQLTRSRPEQSMAELTNCTTAAGVESDSGAAR